MPNTSTTPAAELAGAVPMSHRELALLTQGFAFLFWGAFALVGVAIESLLAGRSPRVFMVVIGLVGALGTALGAWRLHQTADLAPRWRQATAVLRGTGLLTAYLSLMAWMWLQAPTNLYLLCHALAWVGLFLCHLVAANGCVYVFGQVLPSRTLALQGAIYGLAVLLLLFVPFVIFATALLRTSLTGVNSLGQLQYWLAQANLTPYLFFLWLTPLSLTMSLIWTAQDLAWERLTAPPAGNNLPPPSK